MLPTGFESAVPASERAAADTRLRPLCHWDQLLSHIFCIQSYTTLLYCKAMAIQDVLLYVIETQRGRVIKKTKCCYSWYALKVNSSSIMHRRKEENKSQELSVLYLPFAL